MKTRIEPKVVIEKLEMDDPTFDGGISKTAKATLTNPTSKAFTYSAELYLGITKAATSGVGSVTIPAGSSVDVNFTIVTPIAESSYPVFLDISEGGTLLAHYQATENVVVSIIPRIGVGPITWA